MKYSKTLAGNETHKIPVHGRWITLKEAEADLIVFGQDQEQVHLSAGESYPLGDGVKEILVKNSSAGANTFVAEITHRELKKANQNALTVNTTATLSTPNQNNHLPRVLVPAGARQILAAGNPGVRLSLRVSLPDDAASYVTLGGATVDGSSGGYLGIGATDYMETEGALYAWNPGTVDVYVYVLELNKV